MHSGFDILYTRVPGLAIMMEGIALQSISEDSENGHRLLAVCVWRKFNAPLLLREVGKTQ